jgi:hypothetical protein
VNKKAWVVSADMGYGHQRAAYPLKDIAYDRIVNANSDKVLSEKEKKVWNKARAYYEFVSNVNDIPYIGPLIFKIYYYFQDITPFYPLRDESKPSASVKYLHRKIRKGFCKSLINHLKEKDMPMITTFFIPAIAADYYGLKKIYCVVTDTDINRIWVPKDPKKSSITYLAPCSSVYKRLISYGVPNNKIITTGFPLPKENIGKHASITRKALARRIINLDPKKKFIKHHDESLKRELGKQFNNRKKPGPITITFTVGGAGAQKKLGVKLIKRFKNKLLNEKIRIYLVAGTRMDLKQLFLEKIKELGLSSALGKSLFVICELSKKDYFKKFNEILNETDILWTKPSELSFYSALGIPIIMTPPLGSHEYRNKRWLLDIGAGIEQEESLHFSEWLDDLLEEGFLARKAWLGYLNAPRMGTYNIEKVLFKD